MNKNPLFITHQNKHLTKLSETQSENINWCIRQKLESHTDSAEMILCDETHKTSCGVVNINFSRGSCLATCGGTIFFTASQLYIFWDFCKWLLGMQVFHTTQVLVGHRLQPIKLAAHVDWTCWVSIYASTSRSMTVTSHTDRPSAVASCSVAVSSDSRYLHVLLPW